LTVIVLLPQTSGCYRSNVRQTLAQTVRPLGISPTIIADYQPWFGDPQHIDVGYSTQDPEVLRKQIQHAKDLGISAFAADWYGERKPFIDRSYALLQQIASQNHFHTALMYDETQEDNGHATDDALDAFQKAYQAYIGPAAPFRDAYLTYDDRPVIFIFPKRGHTDWNQVRQLVSAWKKPPLLFYADEPPAQYVNDFDGFYGWVNVGSKGWTPDGSNWGEDYLNSFYRKMKAGHPGKFVVGTIWPGFDDSKASWTLNRHIDRRCGKTFEDTLHVFQEHNDGTLTIPFLMIATWNDYEEGTAIEKGVSDCKSNR
jgi:hypothetical protein